MARLLAAQRELGRRVGPLHAGEVAADLSEGLRFSAVVVGGEIAACGALRTLSAHEAEIRAMHVAETARGRGLGAALLAHLIATARREGRHVLRLETGTHPAMAAARALYRGAGFTPCAPRSGSPADPASLHLSMRLEPPCKSSNNAAERSRSSTG